MDEFHRYINNTEGKTPGTIEYILNNFIYIKFKNRHKASVMTEVE